MGHTHAAHAPLPACGQLCRSSDAHTSAPMHTGSDFRPESSVAVCAALVRRVLGAGHSHNNTRVAVPSSVPSRGVTSQEWGDQRSRAVPTMHCRRAALLAALVALAAVAFANDAPAVAPAPGPAPASGSVGQVVVGLLVTGLPSFNASTESALISAVVSVANSGAPAASPVVPSDVVLTVSTVSTEATIVLQGMALSQFPTSAAGTLCFEDSVAAVAGVPVGAISVRPAQATPLGVQVCALVI